MQILYDAHIFLSHKAGGISRYHYELLKGMTRLGCDAKAAGLFIKNQYLRADKTLRKPFFYDPFGAFMAVNDYLLKRAVQNLPENAVFHPASAYEFLNDEILNVKNLTLTVHDLIAEKQNIDAGKNKLFYAQHAKKIIAISEATKKDVIEMFGIDGNKIEVIYHASSLNKSMAQKPNLPVPEQFLLYVGTRGGHKNFDALIRAVAPLLQKHKNLYVFCVGKKTFNAQEISVFQALGIDKKVMSLSAVNDSALAYLYGKAAVFVFPSLAEGFGIPILEAWACGTPAVVSDISCFREVAAEAACYFDPQSQESMTNEIEKVLTDKELQKKLIQKGENRLALFSWEKTIEQTHKFYQSLL